jgi:phosphoglycerate dehydrogenase-like enzyme
MDSRIKTALAARGGLKPTTLAMPYREPASLSGKPFVILGAGTLGRRIAMMWLTQGEIVHLV